MLGVDAFDYIIQTIFVPLCSNEFHLQMPLNKSTHTWTNATTVQWKCCQSIVLVHPCWSALQPLWDRLWSHLRWTGYPDPSWKSQGCHNGRPPPVRLLSFIDVADCENGSVTEICEAFFRIQRNHLMPQQRFLYCLTQFCITYWKTQVRTTV